MSFSVLAIFKIPLFDPQIPVGGLNSMFLFVDQKLVKVFQKPSHLANLALVRDF